MSGPVLLFGGTTEGRRLAEWLSSNGVSVLLSVATLYGKEMVPQEYSSLSVQVGRLSQPEIEELIRQARISLVVDATHPYAEQVGGNIRMACERTGTEYIRVLRPSGQQEEGIQPVENVEQSIRWLSETGKTALLTVGSKELPAFTAVPDYQNRLFARVLPDPETVRQCYEMGFRGRHLIAMQGPFSHEINVALLRDLAVDTLVTKDSGIPGGWEEKVTAAREAGVSLLVIRRPVREEGMSYSQAVATLSKRLTIPQPGKIMAGKRFPLFVSLQDKSAVIVGGGRVATRRAKVLATFGAQITIVSPKASTWVQESAEEGTITWMKREFLPDDLVGATLAVAATSQRQVNHQVGMAAKAWDIPVSVADAPNECSFWFPAIVQSQGLVLGLVSEDGDSHSKVKEAAAVLRKEML